ncbi:sodium-dependent transporter [uncultured Methanobrevibacter sp.]|uniref:sodium-dependent transporter n=1 Tax=uncultured Methanobrevibacter sp. TaxID=253161 RepID=UPI0025FA6E02|nr:sodium-dependent transporter [uncultured Methanobrevibacter sp.]
MAEKNQWENAFTFMMAMIGSAVGLGNIWRFPYIAYSNGGGKFIIPYIVAILCVGIPFIYVEYGAGYRFKASLSKILRNINEKYEVIGWFVLIIPYLILTYYTCIIGWNIIYLFLSFFKGWGPDTDGFFTQSMLHSTTNPMGIFSIVIPIFLSVAFAWVIIWFISHRDLNKGLGKACKILIPLLFFIMAGIVFYSITLPGASAGIHALFTPQWGSDPLGDLLNLNIWLAAFGQIVFSLSLGLCIMLTYSSYLPKGVNLVKNGFIVAITNSAFEIFTAVGMFSIIGYMSLTSHVPIDNVITDGAGLAFIVLPSVFNTMGNAGYIIGPLFFICLFFAAITSALSLVEPLSAALSDKFGMSREKATKYICVVGFLISIIYTSGYGITLLTYFDNFLNQFGLLLTIIIECIIFGWIYKIEDIIETINENSKIKMGKLWKFIIKYFIPIVIGFMWIKGNFDNFVNEGFMKTVIQLILLAVMILVPIILTKLPSKVEDY